MKANPPLTPKEKKLSNLETAIRSLSQDDKAVKAYCNACKDPYPNKLDKYTSGYCVTCHLELEYGIIQFQPGKNCCPASALSSHNNDPDEDPALQNAIKVFEDGYQGG